MRVSESSSEVSELMCMCASECDIYRVRTHARTCTHRRQRLGTQIVSQHLHLPTKAFIFFIIFLFFFTNTQAAAAWDTNSEALTASAHELTRYVCVCMCMYVYVCIDAYNIFIDILCIVQRLHMYEYIWYRLHLYIYIFHCHICIDTVTYV